MGLVVFLKVPAIIIISFGENNVLGQIYFGIYEFRRPVGGVGGVLGLPYICRLLFIKTENYKKITYPKIRFYIIFI